MRAELMEAQGCWQKLKKKETCDVAKRFRTEQVLEKLDIADKQGFSYHAMS